MRANPRLLHFAISAILAVAAPLEAGPLRPARILRPDPQQDTSAAEADSLRDIDRLRLTGIEAFEHRDVRAALACDYEILLASHPGTDLSEYLDTLRKVVLATYRHCGFPEARVAAVFDRAAERIELQVKEGPRYRCGELAVSGLPEALRDLVVKALTEDPKRLASLWKRGDPARFDEGAESRLREKIKDELAAAGYFHARFEMLISRDATARTTKLIVAVADAGPRATVGAIEIVGNKRDSREEVLKYLDLREGAPCELALARRLKERLADSGRYLKYDVNQQPGARTANSDSRALRIKLTEYAEAPPLLAKLRPAEQVLLRLHDWIGRWADDKTGYDLVITGSLRTSLQELVGLWADDPGGWEKESAEFDVQFRSVIDPRRGQAIELAVSAAGGGPIFDALLATTADRLMLISPERRAALVLPNSTGRRLTLDMSADAVEKRYPDDYPYWLNFGFGLPSPKPNAPLFEVRARLTRSFMMLLAHFDDSQLAMRDGICEIRSRDFKIRFDREDGRLIEYGYQDDDLSLTCRTSRGACAAEMRRMDALLAAPAKLYDPASPWKSALQFILDESIEAVRRQGSKADLESIAALRKLVERWNPPEWIGTLFTETYPESKDSFWIPSHRNSWHWSLDSDFGPGADSRKLLTGTALSTYRRFVPKTGWMWPAGRDAMLYWAAGDLRAGWGLADAVQSAQTGPVGELVLDYLGDLVELPLGKAKGRGMSLLSPAGFARDYRPLLTNDSWLGRWTLSLFEALKTLDERELAALVRLIPEPAQMETTDKAARQDAVVRGLRRFRDSGETRVAEALPGVFDSLWNAVLRDAIKLALDPPPALPAQEYDFPDDQIEQTGAEIDAGPNPEPVPKAQRRRVD